jgi:hypothetical protein
MDKIYNSYKTNPKITITKTVRGKRGFNEFVKAVFGGGRITAEDRDAWVARVSEEQKRTCVFFAYKRMLVKNHKIGFKIIIKVGRGISLLGEEYVA